MSSDTIYVSWSINGVKVNFVVDTGAEKTVVSKRVFDKIYQDDQPKLVMRGSGNDSLWQMQSQHCFRPSKPIQ